MKNAGIKTIVSAAPSESNRQKIRLRFFFSFAHTVFAVERITEFLRLLARSSTENFGFTSNFQTFRFQRRLQSIT